eukprot:COSAG04_NODE_263_length_18621_cov_10.926790_5_plen_1200_part_00
MTQCSEDRLPQLVRTASSWGDRAVAAVLLQTGGRNSKARIRQLASAEARLRVLLVRDRRPSTGLAEGALYPINALRNLALAAARTELLLLVDVDQVPSEGLAAALAERGQTLAGALLSSRTALVIPAFEPAGSFPGEGLTLPQLDTWRREGAVTTFGAATYPPGHGRTDETGWLTMALGEEPTPLDPRDWPRCPYAEGYEPYLILGRVGAPPFDERYEGYGRNKIAWVRNLDALGFRLHACPFGFLMHQPHAPSAALGEFKARRMDKILALDAIGAAEVRADPRGAVWKHAPGFLAADLRRQGDGRCRAQASLRTQLGRWRTVAAAVAVEALLADVAAGSLAPGAARLRLEQLFFLQHQFIRDEELLPRSVRSTEFCCRGVVPPLTVVLHPPDAATGYSEGVWVATHATLGYVPQLESMLEAWDGPASIALVVAGEDLHAAQKACRMLAKATTHPLLVTAVVVDWRRDADRLHGGLLYPSNLARKVVFEKVPSPSWIWLLDADLLPCVGARQRLLRQLERLEDTFTVVVTPTFEAADEAGFAQAVGEADMAAMRKMVDGGSLSLFHAHHFAAGHAATDVERWLREPEKTYAIEYEVGFEPFALLHTDLAAQADAAEGSLFDTTLRHPHKDKCAIYLRVSPLAGTFVVLPDVCLLSPPHTPSTLRRGMQAPDGDLFAKAAGGARFDEIARAIGSAGLLQDGGGAVKRADEVMRVRQEVWRGEAADDEGHPLQGWPLVGGTDTLENVTADGHMASLRVSLADGRMGMLTKLMLPQSCDHEAGLAYDTFFPSSFPVSDGRGGKLPGLSIGVDVLTTFFGWSADGTLRFGIIAEAPAKVRWSKVSAIHNTLVAAQTEPVDADVPKFLYHGPIVPDSWISLRQELVVGAAEGTVEVRAAVNGMVVVDAVVSTARGWGRGSLAEVGDWEWPATAVVPPPAQQSGRITAKLHVFSSDAFAPSAGDGVQPGEAPWIGLRALAATGASDIQTIMVVGFHHSGTSLLRHLLGSHEQAHEHVAEIIPTPAQLRSLRSKAAAAGKRWLVIKSPINTLGDVERVACLQADEAIDFVAIRRNLADVIFSLAQRFGCAAASLESEVQAYRDVNRSAFMSGPRIAATVDLEELTRDPQATIEGVCDGLGLSYSPAMLARPSPLTFNNQGQEPKSDHDRLRMQQVNGPIVATKHKWEEAGVLGLLTEADASFLRKL